MTTDQLLHLEARAHASNLNQFLRPVDLWERFRADAHHFIEPISWHSVAWRDPATPTHIRCMALIALDSGEGVLSLLDVFPDDFTRLGRRIPLWSTERVRDQFKTGTPVVRWIESQRA